MVPSDKPPQTLPPGSRRGRLAALSFTLTALLCGVATSRVHAQTTDQWADGPDGGTVQVFALGRLLSGRKEVTLTIPEGESRT